MKKQSDSYCYLTNNIFHIENVYKCDERLLMQGRTLNNSSNLPHYPIESQTFNIIVGNEWSHLQTIALDNINVKAVCIPYGKSFCFFPFIHSDI